MITKKITTVLCLSGALMSLNTAFAVQDIMTLHKGYDLQPNTPVTFKSNFFSDRDLKCTIRTDNKELSTSLNIAATKYDTLFNNLIIREGTSMSIPIDAGKQLLLTIDRQGEIALMNEGKYSINLKC